MSNRFFIGCFITLMLTFSIITRVSAHAGVDHGDNCILKVGGVEVHLGGFQSHDKMKIGKHFCRLFPDTGEVIFTLETGDISLLSHRTLEASFLEINSLWALIFDKEHAFSVPLITKQADSSKNIFTIARHFPSIGLYALQVVLKTNDPEASLNTKQQLFFFVGIPVIKVLVLISFGFFILLMSVVGVRAFKERRSKKSV